MPDLLTPCAINIFLVNTDTSIIIFYYTNALTYVQHLIN